MLSMESFRGIETIDQTESEKTLRLTEKGVSANTLKIISLILSSLTGISAFGIFGQFWSLYDLDYFALLSKLDVLGYICAGFAVLNILVNLVFRKNRYVFIICTILTSISSSLQFIVLATSPFGVSYEASNGLLTHFQYIITFTMGLITSLVVYLYIIRSRKRKRRIM